MMILNGQKFPSSTSVFFQPMKIKQQTEIEKAVFLFYSDLSFNEYIDLFERGNRENLNLSYSFNQ